MNEKDYDLWKLAYPDKWDSIEVCIQCKNETVLREDSELCQDCHVTNRQIDYDSLEVDGIDMRDYPDFCDAYICSGTYDDGEELTDDDLDSLNDDGDLVYSLVEKHLY